MDYQEKSSNKIEKKEEWSATNLINLSGDFSWIDKGAVTPVQDQGLLCNASWAFTTAATLEGARQIKDRELDQLSV